MPIKFIGVIIALLPHPFQRTPARQPLTPVCFVQCAQLLLRADNRQMARIA